MSRILIDNFLKMGEAKRRQSLGLPPKEFKSSSKPDNSPKLLPWLPITVNQKDSFIRLSIRASGLGVVLLILLWVIVRFIGPAAGWWIPADSL